MIASPGCRRTVGTGKRSDTYGPFPRSSRMIPSNPRGIHRRPGYRRTIPNALEVRIVVVYIWCMSKARTNIEIDNVDVQIIMDRYGVRTKKDAVNLALRYLAGQPMTREEALAMRGARAMADMPVDAAAPEVA